MNNFITFICESSGQEQQKGRKRERKKSLLRCQILEEEHQKDYLSVSYISATRDNQESNFGII